METIQFKNQILHTLEGDPFLADEFLCASTDSPCPLVIFAHGYKGFKDWGAWNLVGEKFAQEGIHFVKFNFSKNGTSIDNPNEFTDLEKFGHNTYSQEQRDLELVINHYAQKETVDKDNIFLIGHSRGGGAVLLQAFYNPKVKAVITWASVSNYATRFPQGKQLEQWKKEGVFYVLNGRTKQQMPHYLVYWEDFIKNKDVLDIPYAAQHFSKPSLIVHGTHDNSVSVKEAKLLHQWIKGSKLLLIDGADHVFGSAHPWSFPRLPQNLESVVNQSIKFLLELQF